MLNKILMFIKDRLVVLNTAINSLDKKLSTLSNKVDINTQSINQLIEDTGWVKLSKSTNWNGANDICSYRRIGEFVEIRFRLTPKTNYSVNSNPLLIAYNLPKEAQPRICTPRSVAYHNGKAYRFDVEMYNTTDAGKIKLYINANQIYQDYLIIGHIMYIV